MRFMCVQKRVNAPVFLEFLSRLIAGASRKVILVVDGHPVHKARKVLDFVKKNASGLEIVLLPPYSPELNPDEFVWNDLKNNGIGRKTITGPDMLITAVRNFMRSLQKSPARIASYFQAPSTRYILDL